MFFVKKAEARHYVWEHEPQKIENHWSRMLSYPLPFEIDTLGLAFDCGLKRMQVCFSMSFIADVIIPRSILSKRFVTDFNIWKKKKVVELLEEFKLKLYR